VIRLNKSAQPPILAANAARWLAEFKIAKAAGEVPSHVARRYAHADIKAAVKADSFDKCVYCESKIPHVSFGDVEHLKPKSTFEDLRFDWSNLALVCSRCNNAKGNQYDPACPPIDPYVENPSDEIIACGNLVWGRPGRDRGFVTETVVALNRIELAERRLARLQTLRPLLDSAAKAVNPAIRAALLEQVRVELSDEMEYSFVCRALATESGVRV